MKTPKDILFARHRPAEAKLDEIRGKAVVAVRDHRAAEAKLLAEADRPDGIIGFLRALLQWKPQTWAALAAVWILIFAFKVSTHDASPVAAKKSSLSPEVVAELREQRLFFAELIGMRDSHDAEPPKSFSPRPRSEGRYETVVV